MTPDASHPARRRHPRTALAQAIQRNEWELAALLLLEALTAVSRTLPPGTIDDVLALISETEASDDVAR